MDASPGRVEAERFLVADAKPAERTPLAEELCRGGHQVIVAATAADALNAIRAENPSVVIASLEFAHQGGLAAAMRGRDAPTSGTPLVVLGTPGQIDEVEAVLARGGPTRYFNRTGDFSHLAADIGLWLSRQDRGHRIELIS